jgi:hypothetical protein
MRTEIEHLKQDLYDSFQFFVVFSISINEWWQFL